MPLKSGTGLDGFIDMLVDEVAARLAQRVGGIASNGTRRGRLPPAAKARGGAGQKRDMHCRYPRCPNRSKGPRFRYLCEQHLKLPKREQNAVLAKAAGN